MVNLRKELKELIENNIVALASVNEEKKPHNIAVAYPKIISEDQIIITDNFMKEAIENINKNNNVSLVVWNTGWKNIQDCYGYELKGNVEYFTSGDWLKFVKNMEKNQGLPAKGALLIKISNIKKLT